MRDTLVLDETRSPKFMSLKEKIKSNPRLKAIAHWMLFPRNDYRPRWWIRVASRFISHRGRGAIIRWSARLDIIPSNLFYLGKKALIEDYSTINNIVGDVIIGERSLIGISCVIIGPITIGNDVMLAQNIVLSGLNHGYEDVNLSIREHQTLTQPIVIKDEAWIGANAVIVSGVTIGKHAIVAAGSVVTKDVPPNTIVAGNPARIVKQYNPDTKKWERIKHLVNR